MTTTQQPGPLDPEIAVLDASLDGPPSQHVPSAEDNAWAAGAPWWAQGSTAARLHPHQVRRRTRLGTVLRLGVAAAMIFGAWTVVSSTEIDEVVPVANNGMAFKQSNQALIGGCGPIYQFSDKEAESGAVPALTDDETPNYQAYETTVPMYGTFWPTPVTGDQNFWERADPITLPRPESLLANQYRGDLVVYYTSRASTDDISILREVARKAAIDDASDLRLRVVPWPEERGRLPEDRKIAFATWGASQTCQSFVPSALGDFRAFVPASQAPGFDGSPFPSVGR